MSGGVKKTVFKADNRACTGCGLCVSICPMSILELRDGLCRMTNSRLCLECGGCVRECPQHAITITACGADDAASEGTSKAPREGDPVVFTPVLDTVMRMAGEAFSPRQVLAYDGMDLADLNIIDTEEAKGFVRCYTADKLLKLYQGRFVFFDQLCTEVFGVVPDRGYDLPIFMFDWSETADSIFFVCDFYPTDDPGRNQAYLHDYLHGPLDEIYERHSSIPGLKQPPLYWVRALNSPYMIFGTVEKGGPPRPAVAGDAAYQQAAAGPARAVS